jgi:hypothetical protein
MKFAYGKMDEPSFGSIEMNDEVFANIPYFELSAKIVITTFNELFIGDLAFLAMLIGMNNSSGDHCLLCMFKGRQFNCNHNSITKRTRESLVDCLEQYMLLAGHPTKEPPNNVNGVNSTGLWDIDPQRIIIPILHCPMGLVDKILESFKNWVNLDVEHYNVDATEGARRVYRSAKDGHELAVRIHKQTIEALAVAVNTTAYGDAKVQERKANKVRIEAKKGESKAKEEYDEKVQRHNATKSSLCQQFETVYLSNSRESIIMEVNSMV